MGKREGNQKGVQPTKMAQVSMGLIATHRDHLVIFFWGNKGSADQIEDKSPSQNKWLGLDIRYQNSLFHSLQALIWFRSVFLSIFGS
jgi:hypothetical protein